MDFELIVFENTVDGEITYEMWGFGDCPEDVKELGSDVDEVLSELQIKKAARNKWPSLIF